MNQISGGENPIKINKKTTISTHEGSKIAASYFQIFVKKSGFTWWRRGESNSCPKALLHGPLRAHSVL